MRTIVRNHSPSFSTVLFGDNQISNLMPRFDTHITPEQIQRYTASGDWPNRLLTDFLDDAVAASADKTAIIDSRGSITYGELAAQATRCAHGLLALGLRAGDVMALQLPNWKEFLILHLAATRIGVVSSLITPVSRDREVVHMLKVSEACLWVVPDTFRGHDYCAMAARLRAELPDLQQLMVVGQPALATDLGWNTFMATAWEKGKPSDDLGHLRPLANDVTEIVFTSGATGAPKGVMHTSNTIVAPQLAMAASLQLTPDDVIHIASTIAHQTGFLNGVRLPVQLGATVVLQDVWNPEQLVEWIAEHRITVSSGSATFLLDMLRARNLAQHDLSSFRIFRCGGGPIPRALLHEAREKLPHVAIHCGWGQTENAVVTLSRIGDPDEKVLNTDGRAQPGMAVRVVDDRGRLLAAGKEGRLQCRGPFMFVGYIKQEALTRENFDGEWFDTGDLATLDAEGYVRITGRLKDIIIRGGENIPVKYVEDILYEDPRVRDAAIVAMPDPRLGERACAFVICRDGSTLDMKGMQAFLAERGVAKVYWPERLEIASELPRTANGKIRKADLRARLAQEVSDAEKVSS
jgi:cyclohexanecarboxylate-CoA ligase